MSERKLVSVIVPAYDEEDVLPELYRRLAAVFDAHPKYDFEAILVENGSHDRSWELLREIHGKDPRFKVMRLSRNFRMEGGLTAGLAFARGDACVLMTADLQDPPEMITKFLEKWEEGYENVYGIVTRRHGTSLIRRFNSTAFYWLINRLTSGLFPRNASDFRLVDRKVYEAVRNLQERNRFMRGLFVWAGFRQIGIEHDRPARYAGEAKSYTFQVIELALKGIFAYTYLPLRMIALAGIALSAFAFVYLLWFVYRTFAYGVPFAGFGTLMGAVLLMFGVLFTMLGILAEYVGLIYEEVKQRPNFIVQETLGLAEPIQPTPDRPPSSWT